MLSPSGSALIAITSAPAARSACGPTTEAAPFAQSSTTLSPASGGVDGARPGGRRTPRPTRRTASPGRRRRRPGGPTARRRAPRSRARAASSSLTPAAGEELDAVVGHRVVGGRDHHAEVGAQGVGQVGDARRRQHAEPEHVDPGRGQAGHDRGSRNCPEIRVSRPTTASGRCPVNAPRSPAPGPRPHRRSSASSAVSVTVGQPADPVGAEDPLACASQTSTDQRLLYCGALRAFLRPAFLRSMTRASRVSRPAFFRVGRLASTSIAFRARATPRRSAPAWPVMPPPWMRAMTSKRPSSCEGRERLVDDLLVQLVREVGVERAAVDGPLAGAGHDAHAGHGLLATAGRRGRGDGRRAGGRVGGRGALGGVRTPCSSAWNVSVSASSAARWCRQPRMFLACLRCVGVIGGLTGRSG